MRRFIDFKRKIKELDQKIKRLVTQPVVEVLWQINHEATIVEPMTTLHYPFQTRSLQKCKTLYDSWKMYQFELNGCKPVKEFLPF